MCARAADEAVESVVKKWLQQAEERDEGTEGRREERTEVSTLTSELMILWVNRTCVFLMLKTD